MDTIKTIQIYFDPQKFENEDQKMQQIFQLEEKLYTNDNIVVTTTESSVIVYNTTYFNNNNISFNDYIEQGKILKDFLITNNLATPKDYNKYFAIKTESVNTDFIKPEVNLDNYIYKVPSNDEKLLEVKKQLEKIKKNT